jgi:hypothetical protein
MLFLYELVDLLISSDVTAPFTVIKAFTMHACSFTVIIEAFAMHAFGTNFINALLMNNNKHSTVDFSKHSSR